MKDFTSFFPYEFYNEGEKSLMEVKYEFQN